MLKLIFALGICFVGFAGTLFMDPIWGIAAFSLFTHITPQQLSPEIIEPLRLPLMLSIWALLNYIINSRYTPKFGRWPMEVWLLLAMLAGMFLGTTNAINTEFVYHKMNMFFKFIVFYILIINILDTEDKIRLFIDAQVVSAAWLVYRCWDLRHRFDYRFENFGGGVISDSNHFAGALVLLMPFVIRRVMKGNVWIRIGAAIGAFGMIMSIIITGSRGAFLGLAVQGVAFFFFYKEYRKYIAIGFVGMVIAIAPFVTDYYMSRIGGIFNHDEIADTRDRASAESRLASWSLALETFQNMPLAGCGMGNFRYYMGYYKEGLNWGELGHVAHSIWLQVLGEGGLVVTTPFVLILALFYWRMGKVARYYRRHPRPWILEDIYAVQVSMTGLLVCATFVNRLFYEPIYWLSGIAVAYIYLMEREVVTRQMEQNKMEVEGQQWRRSS
ncbi:MAG: O-antigen ligase family protein [Desulfobacterales bacterium]|nr:O-antigen ligase family protein [Desulfobacterales bacterium]